MILTPLNSFFYYFVSVVKCIFLYCISLGLTFWYYLFSKCNIFHTLSNLNKIFACKFLCHWNLIGHLQIMFDMIISSSELINVLVDIKYNWYSWIKIPIGKLIKRQRLPKNDRGDNWHWKDINNGMNITFYGKVFHVTNCDKFTQVSHLLYVVLYFKSSI